MANLEESKKVRQIREQAHSADVASLHQSLQKASEDVEAAVRGRDDVLDQQALLVSVEQVERTTEALELSRAEVGTENNN